MPNTKEKGKLIEILSKHIPYGHATLCLIAEELIADGVRLEEKQATSNGWISVTERLPQEDEPLGVICKQVQVLLSDGFVTTGWCNRAHRVWFYLPYEKTKFIGHDYKKTPVIAWQPLAQPPKGE